MHYVRKLKSRNKVIQEGAGIWPLSLLTFIYISTYPTQVVNSTKNFFLFQFLFIFLFSSVTCTKVSHLEEKVTGDTLVVPEHQNLGIIHPLLTSTTLSSRLNKLVFDGLIQLDEQLKPQPHLAKSWEQSDDGLSWIFNIRPGIKFHDGVELTAEDVAFTFEIVKDPEIGRLFRFIFQEVEKIIVEDKYTIHVRLKKPIASFLGILFEIGILPKHLLEGENIAKTSFNNHPIGTGPFKIKSWSPQKAELEANSSYFLGRPYLDQILVNVYQNQEAAWAKLISGEADFFYSLRPEDYAFLEQVPTFKIYSVPRPHYYMIGLNLNLDIFSDQKIRQALNYAINKEEIVSKSLNGQGEVSSGTILPGSWAYNSRIKPYPYNPKKALELFTEAGWVDHDGDHFLDKDGKDFEFIIHVNTGDNLKEKVLLKIQQNLEAVGIKVKIRFFEASNIEFLLKKEFQAFFPEIRAMGDPDFSYQIWHSTQINGGYNFCSYNNPVVDGLLEQGRAIFNLEERKKIYYKFQKEIYHNPPGIFLFWTNILFGVQERFKGVKLNYVAPFYSNVNEWYVPKSEQRYTE